MNRIKEIIKAKMIIKEQKERIKELEEKVSKYEDYLYEDAKCPTCEKPTRATLGFCPDCDANSR